MANSWYIAGNQSQDKDDTLLLLRVKERDANALLEIYQRYTSRVYSAVLRVVGDEAVAEELVQDLFVRLWERPSLYDASKGSLLSWLVTVARNLSRDYMRRELRRGNLSVAEESPAEPAITLDSRIQGRVLPDPDSLHAIHEAMALLPKAQRVVIELAYFEGLTHAELAARLGESLGTVKSRLRLGISKMREALTPPRNWSQPVP